MSAGCTLCAILNGELDASEVPLEFLHASSARMMTHFVMHPSVTLGNSIAKVFTAIASHADTLSGPQGPQLYAEIANTWRDIIERAKSRTSEHRRSMGHLH